jgi:putative SOS response-associated peptidase YedK
MLLRATRFGDLRRRTLSWCRSTRTSASNAARDRNSPIKAHQINLQRSPIERTINRFAGVSQLFWVCGRDRVRTFTIITVPSNDMIARIHDRMPAILRSEDYERWLGSDPDPYDLLRIFPSEPMRMWPISKRVNSPRNDDEDLLTEIDLAAAS